MLCDPGHWRGDLLLDERSQDAGFSGIEDKVDGNRYQERSAELIELCDSVL